LGAVDTDIDTDIDTDRLDICLALAASSFAPRAPAPTTLGGLRLRVLLVLLDWSVWRIAGMLVLVLLRRRAERVKWRRLLLVGCVVVRRWVLLVLWWVGLLRVMCVRRSLLLVVLGRSLHVLHGRLHVRRHRHVVSSALRALDCQACAYMRAHIPCTHARAHILHATCMQALLCTHVHVRMQTHMHADAQSTQASAQATDFHSNIADTPHTADSNDTDSPSPRRSAHTRPDRRHAQAGRAHSNMPVDCACMVRQALAP